MIPSLVGKQIGKFRVVALLARGGVVDVYRAVQSGLDREVVVKVLAPELAQDPRVLERFRESCQRAARLSHPNIVAIYDSGHVDGLEYFVSEYLRSESLQELMDTTPFVPIERCLGILEDLIRALLYAHEKGVLHGDLRPSRVRFDPRGTALLTGYVRPDVAGATDPGSALRLDEAPEVRRGGERTERSDLYQLGRILYRMLTGIPPARADRGAGTAAVLAPRELVPAISEELSSLTMRLIADVPEERPGSAVEVLLAYNQLEKRPRAQPVGPGQRLTIRGDGAEVTATPPLPPRRPRPSPPRGRRKRRSVPPEISPVRRIFAAVAAAVCLIALLARGAGHVCPMSLQIVEKSVELHAKRAVIGYRSSQACYSCIEYWDRARPAIKHRTPMESLRQSEHSQAIAGLVPGVSYRCRVLLSAAADGMDELFMSPVFEFQTREPAGAAAGSVQK